MGGEGSDAAYDAIVATGDAVVPCLIEKISDATRMRDPRCPRMSDRTTVGDVAYFVLTHIAKLGFVELLPADIKQSYKSVGTSAFDRYIQRKGSRKQLQSRVREWWQKKSKSA